MNTSLAAGDICHRSVAVAYPSLAVNEAARLMRTRHVGCLVIVDEVTAGESVVVGVLTDRDVALSVVAADLNPYSVRVADVMTTSVVTVREQDSLVDVLATMQRHKVRRVPVTGARNVLLGIVSLDDVIASVARQLQAVAAAVTAAASHDRTALP